MASSRPGRPGEDKEALWSSSAAAIGCAVPDMSNGFDAQAIADWLQCVMNGCDEQEEKCLADEDLTEAKEKMQKKIEAMRAWVMPTGRPWAGKPGAGRPGRPGRPSGSGN